MRISYGFTSFAYSVEVVSQQTLVPGASVNYFNQREKTPEINSREEAIDYLSLYFEDGETAFESIKDMKSKTGALIEKFPRLIDLDQEQQEYVLYSVMNHYLDNRNPFINGRIGYCEDAKERGMSACVAATAVGAISCLPSLAAAGWGYFICGGAVGITAIMCEVAVNDEYEECINQ